MLSGISIWQLLIVLLIVVLLFGTKKLKGMGSDLGSAVKGFKDSIKEGEEKQSQELENHQERSATTIDQSSEKENSERQKEA